LGFDSLKVNSYGAVAAADYLTESCSVLSMTGARMTLLSPAQAGYVVHVCMLHPAGTA
jgi:argininosuccinate lyase